MSGVRETDILVVGAGMAGCGTAMYAALATPASQRFTGTHKSSVTLIDSQPIVANEWASSCGDSRMYRKMYSDAFYAQMQLQALENWSQVEALSGEKLLHENGLLFYGEETGETVEGSVAGAKETMKQMGIPFEEYSGAEIDAKWKGVRAGDKPMYEGVFEHTAGHARASATCNAMVRVAEAHGCQVNLSDGLAELKKVSPGLVEAVTESGTVYRARRCVLCLGAWTREFFNRKLGLDINLDIWRVHYAHYEVDRDIAAGGGYPQMFCFRKERDDGNDGGLYYAFSPSATETAPGIEDPHAPPQIKVGVDFKTLHPIDTPATMDEFDYTPSEYVLSMIEDWVRNNINGTGRRTSTYVAPYSMAPDPYFVLDKLPGTPEIVVFAGGQGRAFKFGPLLGECLAALALDKTPPMDISKFKITRDGLGLKKMAGIANVSQKFKSKM